MTKLIVLPGNSKRNQQWGEAAVEYYSKWFDESYLQYYKHWETDSQDIDIEAELEKLKFEAEGTKGDIYVFAKSIGSLLTLLSVHRGELKPAKCIFFGMPLELASEEIFKDDWTPLNEFQVPAIAFHNDEDPISYTYTKAALVEHNPAVSLYTMEKDNHDYTEFADYEEKIKHFIEI